MYHVERAAEEGCVIGREGARIWYWDLGSIVGVHGIGVGWFLYLSDTCNFDILSRFKLKLSKYKSIF